MYRLLPKGKKVFSTALQENVMFEKPIIIEMYDSDNNFNNTTFGYIKELLFNFSDETPTLINKPYGKINFNFEDTEPYEIPKPSLI